MTKRVSRTDLEGHGDARLAAPGSIEAMEARGQRELTQATQLPREGYNEFGRAAVLGFEVIGDGADPLFYDVRMPEGFRIQATDHSMWSDLLDAEGKKVASIFYKAAYYDRRAFMRWEEKS